MISPARSAIRLTLAVLILRSGDAFYLPGNYPHKYLVGDPLSVKVNSLTSIDTEDAADVIPNLEKTGSGPPGYMAVGFEVVPCSFQHDTESIKNLKMYAKYPAKMQCDLTTVAMAAKEKQPLVFTYEVSFVESNIKWPSRWDAYLKLEGAKVHWFSILNSLW